MRLVWDANPEPDIKGYELSYGSSPGSYTSVMDVGNLTTAEIAGLTPGQTYYFTVSAYNDDGFKSEPSPEISYTFVVVPTGNLRLQYVDSEDPDGYQAEYAFDGNPNTFWHTEWRTNTPPPPHELQIDLSSVQVLRGFRYLPRQDNYDNGIIAMYEFYISTDGVQWGDPVASGTLPHTKAEKEILFTPKAGRFIRLRALSDVLGSPATNVAELTMLQGEETAVNNIPIALAQTIETAEDTPFNITLSGTDAEGSALSYVLVTQPSQGTLTGTPPNLTYVPAADLSGSDGFTFRVNDGLLNSAIATVSISVTPVNDEPVADGKILTTKEDTSLNVMLSGTDLETNVLTFIVVDGPAHGTLTGTGPTMTYTPAPDFSGNDNFTYRVNDGSANSPIATVSIHVTSVNDGPIATSTTVTVTEDVALPIVLRGSDKDLDPLIYTIATGPSGGTLSGTPPYVIYSPSKDFNGSDRFTFYISDGIENSTTATVNIQVTAVNDAPVAIPRSITTQEDTVVAVGLAGSDADGDHFTYEIVSNPIHGVLSGSYPDVNYIPFADFTGSDSFTYRVHDGTVNSATVIVSISVTAVNDAPVATSTSFVTQHETAIPIRLGGTDIENNSLAYIVVTQPAHGTLAGSPPALTYQPAPGFTGNDDFTFRVSDGLANSAVATVSISVAAPVPPAATVISRTGWSLHFVDSQELADSPGRHAFDGDPATVWQTQWRAGIIAPPPHEIQINLGAAHSINGFQILPRQDGFSVGTIAEYEFYVSADGLNWGIPVASGTFESSAAQKQVIFTPKTGRYIRLRALSEVTGLWDTCIAELNVLTGNLTNEAPLATAKSVVAEEDTAISFTLSGNDPESSPLTYSVVTGPLNGNLSGTPPHLSYIPAPDFHGSDQFTFRVNDGAGFSIPTTVSITVTRAKVIPGNSAPSFTTTGFDFATREDERFSHQLAATDPNLDDVLIFRKIAGPAWLSVSETGVMSGTPANSDVGSASFTVAVSDFMNASAIATGQISVENTNDAPSFGISPLLLPDATENILYRDLTLGTAASDSDLRDGLTYSKVTGPDWLSVEGSGTLVGTPPAGSAGLNSFTVRVTDTAGLFGETSIGIHVHGNSLPLPWTLHRVGTGNLDGTASYSAGTFTVAGAGILSRKRDSGNFGWQTLSGDGEITAQVSQLGATGSDARVGVMIRESLAMNSRQVFIGIDEKGLFHWLRRTATGGQTAQTTRKPKKAGTDWLRLVRKGNTITALCSGDGKAWEKVGTVSLDLPENSYIGLSVSSGDNGTLNTSQFSKVRVKP